MDRPRVLIVEDRPSVLRLMATILERGHDVTTACDGTTALSLIASDSFDVVLTDIRMPGASGFDVLRAVKSRAPRTRVVMITAYANVADAVAAIKLGAYDYVAKPLDADEISLVVARAVAQAQETPGAAEEARAHEDRFGAAAESVEVSVGFHHAVELARDAASRRYLVGLMRLFRGNVTQAATRAGMTRESLHRVLKKYDVRSEDHKQTTGVTVAPPASQAGGTLLHAVK
jgi:DNA-binding NtrC family response regulator